MSPEDLDGRIRGVLGKHGRLGVDAARLGESDDLHQAGMDSHAVVTVMLALEKEFRIEFPEQMLQDGNVFESIRTIRDAVSALVVA